MKMMLAVNVMMLVAGMVLAESFTVHSLDMHDTSIIQSKTIMFNFQIGNQLHGGSPELQNIVLRYDRRSQSRTNYRLNRIHWQLYKAEQTGTNLVWELDERYPSDTSLGSIPPRWGSHDWGDLGLKHNDTMELHVAVYSGDYHNSVREILVESDWMVANQLPETTQPLKLGVNLSGAEHGDPRTGVEGIDYAFAEPSSLDYFVSHGLTIFRVCLSWERMLPDAGGVLNEHYMQPYDKLLETAETHGATLILDIHNYGRRDNFVIGSEEVPIALFASTWGLLAERYANRAVWFSLMNEFHTMPGDVVVNSQNAAIEAIRATGATNRIVVSGNAWSGAHSWHQSWYGTPNAELMLEIVDSHSNFVVAVHMYGDEDASGTSPVVVSETIGRERLAGVTDWAKANGITLYLEEFGFASNATAMLAMEDTLRFVKTNESVFVAATYWAAGPRWGDYMFSIEPDPETYRTALQLKVLAEYTDVVRKPFEAGIELGTDPFEDNVISEEILISWHKGNGILPGYTYKNAYTMIVIPNHTAVLSAVEFDNGSAWNRITEMRISAVAPGGGEHVVFHSDSVPFGPGCRIEFEPTQAAELHVTLLDSMNRADFRVTGLIERGVKQMVRIVPHHAQYGALTRVFASENLISWGEVDTYIYGVKIASYFPAENSKQFFKIIQDVAE